MRYEIRELGVGGILDQAIAVTRDHFWLFVKIVVVLFLPVGLIGALFMAQDVRAAQAGGGTGMWRTAIFGIVNGLIIYPITNAAIIYAVASSYLNRTISVGLAFSRAWRVFLPLLGTTTLAGLVVGLGFVLLIIPGFIFMFWYFLIAQVVVLEGLSGQAAMKRSRQLMKGNVSSALVLTILVWVINVGAGFLQALIPQIELRTCFNAAIQSVLIIFVAAAWVIFYFSCRAKAEHFDLTLLADAVGADDDQPTGTLDISPGEAR